MARVAETIVEDWLNRQGYFTIRGLKRGQNEIDLLAYHPRKGEALHVEVTSSMAPAGWIGGLSYTRLEEGIERFVNKKYHKHSVRQMRNELCPNVDEWRLMLVHGRMKNAEEQRSLLEDRRIEVRSLLGILNELAEEWGLPFDTDTDAAHFAALADAHRNSTREFIMVAPDCPVDKGTIPRGKTKAKTVPVHQYEVLSEYPYEYTENELAHEVHVERRGLQNPNLEKRDLRRSELPKKWGWGIHYDKGGKLAIVGCETEEYVRLARAAEARGTAVFAYRNKRT